MATSQSKYGRRFDEEFKREVAALACRPGPGLLHHSGRGSQYASDARREPLRRHGVTPSMSRPGNCYDIAKMESFWATLRGGLFGDHVFATRAEARSALFRYIEIFHRRTRLHGALGFYSPVDCERNLKENPNHPALRPVRENEARSHQRRRARCDLRARWLALPRE